MVMETIIEIYKKSLSKGFGSVEKQANAYCLQRVLFEQCELFGDLYKSEHFQRVFRVSPNPPESVSFVRFWRGVEDVSMDYENILTGTMALELRRSCYTDNEYVKSLRVFRDELLKNRNFIKKSALLDAIFRCRSESGLFNFWSQVLDNSREMFDGDKVSLVDISSMIFGFLCRNLRLEKCSELVKISDSCRTISTCTSIEDIGTGDLNTKSKYYDNHEVKNPEQFLKLDDYGGDETHRVEQKYRNLLMELGFYLPKFYNGFCTTRKKLKYCEIQLERLLERNVKMSDEFAKQSSLFLEEAQIMKAENERLRDSNENLQRTIESNNIKIESYKVQLSNLNSRLKSLDSAKLYEELQIYMAKCDGLKKTNESLLSKISVLERCLSTEQFRNIIGDGEDAEKSREEIDKLTKQLKWYEDECKNLTGTLNELKDRNRTLSGEISKMIEDRLDLSGRLENANLANLKLEQNLREFTSTKYEELLKKLTDVEKENADLVGELESLREENQRAVSDNTTLKKEKSEVLAELERLEEVKSSFEKQLDAFKNKSDKIDETLAEVSILRKELEEERKSNLQLKSRIENLVWENARLTRIGLNATDSGANKLTHLINKSFDSDRSSHISETTMYDDSERKDFNSVRGHTLKINPALAETRRLNTVNAVKFGHLSTFRQDEMNKFAGSEPPLIVHRRVWNLQRYDSICSVHSQDDGMMDFAGELGLEDNRELNSPKTDEDESEVFQNAASYLSNTFSLKDREHYATKLLLL